MENFHRKTLITDAKPQFFVREFCITRDDCDDHLPPPPPPPPPSQNHALSPLIIFTFCSIGVAFSFICYLTIIKTCRACRNRSRRRSHGNTDETHEDFIDEDHGTVVFHPIWLINTIGLDQSVIDSIEVFKYRKGDGLIEGTDCAVCLGEFQDEESLRLLPKCSHAFHVPCIDTWLRSHKHCPLCRAPIVNDTTNARLDPNLIESNTQEEIPNGDSQNETNQVENAQEIFLTNADNSEKKSLFVSAISSGVRVQSDLTDHRREELQPMRRSVSMHSFSASMVHSAVASIDLLDQEKRSGGRHSKKPNVLQKSSKGRASSSGVSIYSRVMKSSSFGRCSIKASSSHNRSY